ncbi:hypothetical protein K435DRAFT_735312 [Dendrothele bispora CBS 962.96]|uniref:DUF6534 domain-containing protein n=1 Tax=Dendrothele bispora (strain CBS 962.96) TaxID=1314807 RepID=A0A4S8L039_DENBC|nr:hypothetical protein K435DRAFT_735312 [Dendrothele bispora CBS 962.96]
MAGLPFTVDNTLGALLVGFAASCVLFGVVGVQVFSYFRRYPQDKSIYKGMVILIGACELLDQILTGHVVYFYLITNFFNPAALLIGKVSWSIILQQTAGATVGSIVTLCYSIRVWRFSNRNLFITATLVGLSLGHLATSIVFTVQAFHLPTLPAVANLRGIGTIALGLGAATDILTAASLCYFLGKLRTGHKNSDTLVDTLMRYAVSTGVVTSAVSITTLVLFNVQPHNLIFIGVFFVLSKFYAISFMATLNTRRSIRGRGTDRNQTSDAGATRTTGLQFNSRIPETPTNITGSMGVWVASEASAQESSRQEHIDLQYVPRFKEPYSTEVDDYYYQPRAI